MGWFDKEPKKKKFKKDPDKLGEQLKRMIREIIRNNPYIPRLTDQYTYNTPYGLDDAAAELIDSYPELREVLLDLDVKPNYWQAYDNAHGNVAKPSQMSKMVEVDVILFLVGDDQGIMDYMQERIDIWNILMRDGQTRLQRDEREVHRLHALPDPPTPATS